METNAVIPRPFGRPDDTTIDIDLLKVRTQLSFHLGWIASETDARLWVVSAGFRPTRDRRWAGPPPSVQKLEHFLKH